MCTGSLVNEFYANSVTEHFLRPAYNLTRIALKIVVALSLMPTVPQSIMCDCS